MKREYKGYEIMKHDDPSGTALSRSAKHYQIKFAGKHIMNAKTLKEAKLDVDMLTAHK